MTSTVLDRRSFLRMGGALSVLGAGAPLAFQLAASSAASAATANDYKAIVCVYLFGGNDAHNTVIATDPASWAQYWAARSTVPTPIALMPAGTGKTPVGDINPVTGRISRINAPEAWGGVLPIAPLTRQIVPGTANTPRTFALHPYMGAMKTLFAEKRLAIVPNVGTLIQPTSKPDVVSGRVPLPPNLFSHNDQQSIWQSGKAEGQKVGWGGAFGDLFAPGNSANPLFTSISAASNALFLAGRTQGQYIVNPGGSPAVLINGNQKPLLFNSSIGQADFNQIIQDASSTSELAEDYAAINTRSINAATIINGATSQGAAALIPPAPIYNSAINGSSATNPLAAQFQTVAKIIAAAPSLGIRRQVFFVNLGSFDTHANQNDIQPDLLGQLAQALAYFDKTLQNIGGVDFSAAVTTFTASDFGRSWTTNGTGTDHAWGGHHFVMGGAVKGGDIYGAFPTVGVDSSTFTNPNMSGSVLIPTTSVDQYGATLGAWLGVAPGDLATIFPNYANFGATPLGFI
jgi:uncharacterized protein (DUF1501 family)